MRDYLIENLAGMCRYNCKRDRLSSDYCTVCLAAERLTKYEAQLQAQDEAIATLRAGQDAATQAMQAACDVLQAWCQDENDFDAVPSIAEAFDILTKALSRNELGQPNPSREARRDETP